MKAFTLAIALLMTSFSGSAMAECNVLPLSSAPEFSNLMRKLDIWPVSDAQCAFLTKRGLRLNVVHGAMVHGNASVGWATVRLSKGDSLVSAAHASATAVDTAIGSSVRADQLVADTVKEAVRLLDFEAAARELAQSQAPAKRKAG